MIKMKSIIRLGLDSLSRLTLWCDKNIYIHPHLREYYMSYIIQLLAIITSLELFS